MNCDEFYQERDDRTDRDSSVRNYQTFKTGIYLGNDFYENEFLQTMFRITVNILARWCRRVIIHLENGNNSSRINSFIDRILEEMHKIDPCGDFSVANIHENQVDTLLIIGGNDYSIDLPKLWINADGWVSHITNEKPIKMTKDQMKFKLGAIFASIQANAGLFRIANKIDGDSPYSFFYNLYNLEITLDLPSADVNQDSEQIDLGKVLLIGCGAVGSSLIYLLPYVDVKMDLVVIDPDGVEISNTNRSLLFTQDHISRPKVEVAEIYLGGQHNVKCLAIDFSEYVKSGRYKEFNPDIIISLANGHNVWNTIQNNLPPLLFHAATTSSWGINVGRHIPFVDWCINCALEKFTKDEFIPRCADGEIPTEDNVDDDEEKTILAALPFLSPAAAVVLLSELLKIKESRNNQISLIQLGFINQGSFLTLKRKYGKCSICSAFPSNVYHDKIKDTKFYYLSQQNVAKGGSML